MGDEDPLVRSWNTKVIIPTVYGVSPVPGWMYWWSRTREDIGVGVLGEEVPGSVVGVCAMTSHVCPFGPRGRSTLGLR